MFLTLHKAKQLAWITTAKHNRLTRQAIDIIHARHIEDKDDICVNATSLAFPLIEKIKNK
jgi:hypothetical protein